MALGKPYISFCENSDINTDNPYKRTEAVPKVRTLRELEKALDFVLDEKNSFKLQKEMAKFVKGNLGEVDGKATERTIELIKEMANS